MVWTRGPTIGRGSSATVSVAFTATGELIAVKSANLSSSEPLKREGKIMSRLDSPYIVKYLGSDTTYEQNENYTYNLFLEYIPGQTLHDLIASKGGSLNEKSIRFYANQILKGLNYIHHKGIAHCDIKGHNVLVGNDGIVKIADFGCAVIKRASSDCNHSNGQIMSGTPAYMSPEMARGEGPGFAADIWALGCTIIEMATGHSPWRDSKDPVSALYRIGYSDDVPEIPTRFSDSAKDFINKCLARSWTERWSAKELLCHSFFDGIDEYEFTTKISPTSVMDRGVWDDSEGSCSSSVRGGSMDLDLVFNSFDDRVTVLMKVCHGVVLDWEEDGDDWVNVREVFELEDDVINRENLYVEDYQELIEEEEEEPVEFLSFEEDEICAVEDLLFDSFNDLLISIFNDDVLLISISDNDMKDEFVSPLERILIEFSSFSAKSCLLRAFLDSIYLFLLFKLSFA